MGTAVFWTEPTGMVDVTLRRYTRERGCTVNPWGHARPSGIIERIPRVIVVADPDRAVGDGWSYAPIEPERYAGNEWWPAVCDCGYRFTDDDVWQVNQEPVYAAADGRPGEWHQRAMPVGAMWEATWLRGMRCWNGPDGMALEVRVPVAGHDWMPDMQASNCTRRCPWTGVAGRDLHPEHGTKVLHYSRLGWTPEPAAGSTSIAPHNGACDPGFVEHKCWVRHRDPRAGELHVDKAGETCAAGAGSIVTPDWHGFCHGSVLA